MPYADLGGYRMYYEELGEGEPLVFLHGFSLDRRSWYAQAEYFKAYYRVLLVDALGHGLSDAPPHRYGRFERVEDMARLFEVLNIRGANLAGLSMGGSTAIGFVLEHTELLKSLTLVSTGAAGYNVGKKFERFDRLAREVSLEAALEAWKAMTLAWFSGERAHARELLSQMIDGFSGVPWLDPMRGQYRTQIDLDHVHRISIPTLIVAGQLDEAFLPLALDLHAHIPRSQLTILPGLGHLLNLEAPRVFDQCLESFLQAL